MRRAGLRSIVLAAALLGATVCRAATITVATTADTGVACTLRDAITAANDDQPIGGCSAGNGADTIDLSNLSGAILLGSALPELMSAIDLRGPGARTLAVNGQGAVPILVIGDGAVVTVEDVRLTNGLAPGTGRGGCLENVGTITLTRVAVDGCRAFNGGGIAQDGGSLTLEECTVSGNMTTGNSGAGIVVSEGTLLVARNTTISNNVDPDNGREGGGIGNFGGSVTLTNCTLFANTASGTGAFGGGLVNAGPTGSITLINTIVAGTSAGGNCSGTITSGGHNLSDDTTCHLNGPGDQDDHPAGVLALADNGGPTNTNALAPDSAAIDTAGASACPPIDQRGFGRPVDGNGDGVRGCDVGAYERACPDGGNLPAGTLCAPDGNVCTDDVCDGHGACIHPANTLPCDDGNACTTGDVCRDSVCVPGTAVTCAACESCDPHAGCRSDVRADCRGRAAGTAVLSLRNPAGTAHDTFQWVWRRGATTSASAFGDPRSSTDYTLCLFDESTSPPAVVLSARVPAGGRCGHRTCWRSRGANGFAYASRARTPDGVASVLLDAADPAAARLDVQGGGPNAHLPHLPLSHPLTARVQLQAGNGQCWEASYSERGLKHDTARRFDAHAD